MAKERRGDGFWETVRSSVRTERERMPQLAQAPLILREGLIFPYLDGVDFVRWFEGQYGDEPPYNDRLPVSSEQILYPERYAAGDTPVVLEVGGDPLHDDNLGQFEMRVLFTELLGSESTAAATVRDWGGDRYGVYAVLVHHDVAGSGAMERHWYGKPKEPTATSNDAPSKFGPPKFKKAKFTFDTPSHIITITVK